MKNLKTLIIYVFTGELKLWLILRNIRGRKIIMYENFIGKQSVIVKNIIERGAVKKFAEAIGDPHPIYFDEEYAKNTKHKKPIVPPTFAKTFNYGQIEGLELPKSGLIHGEQAFYYERPLKTGEVVFCSRTLKEINEKKGSRGVMLFLNFEEKGESVEGETIFVAKRLTIITEKVRQQMEEN